MKFRRVAQNLYRLDPHGTYYAQLSINGAKHRHSLKTKKRAVAERKLPEKLRMLRHWQEGETDLTFKEVAERWESTVLAARNLKPASRLDRQYNLLAIRKAWPGLDRTRLYGIGRTDCERWYARRRPVVSPQRFNNELGTLRQIFKFALREGVILVDPTDTLRRVPITRKSPVIPTREQFQQIITDLHGRKNTRAAWFLELLAYSGMRRNEAASLKRSDIDHARGIFTIHGGDAGTKSGHVRMLPLFEPLRELLDRIPPRAETDLISWVDQCRDALTGSCERLKLPHFDHHSLRHFFCSNAIEAGIDFKTIAEWLGHSDGGLLVAKTYGHLRAEHSTAMAKRMVFSASRGNPEGNTEGHTIKKA